MSLFLCRDYHLKKVTHVLVIFSSTVSQFVTNDTIYLMQSNCNVVTYESAIVTLGITLRESFVLLFLHLKSIRCNF